MLNNNNQDDFYVIDAHCDTLMAITGRSMNKEERNPRDFFADNTSVHLDFPKLVRGRVVCQVMAIFLEDSQKNNKCVPHLLVVFLVLTVQAIPRLISK